MKKLKMIGVVYSSLICLTGVSAAGAFAAEQGITEQKEMTSTKKIWSDRVMRERAQAMQDPSLRPVTEALTAVEETQKAAELLDKNKGPEAKAALERALGKTDVVLSSHPSVALIPVSVNVRVIDVEASEKELKKMTSDVKDLVKKDQLQEARALIRDLASEIDILTVNLPIATYPQAMRSAVSLIDQKKLEEAKMQLLMALNSLALVERSIPLPVVRAQALVDEVNSQVTSNKIDKTASKKYLEDADNELKRAELLGYGKKKEDFKSLHSQIKDLQKSIAGDKESKSIVAKLKNELKSLRQRMERAPASE